MKIDFSGFSLGEKRLIKKVFSTAVKMPSVCRFLGRYGDGVQFPVPVKNLSVSVACVGEQEIAALNKQFRQIDAATDVLSFPTAEVKDGAAVLDFALDQKRFCLGDIAICREVVAAQAHEYGHGQRRELAFLALHGLLHLFGYTHDDGQDAENMEKLTEQILAKCKITR